ncbi:MAG: hypothetical protein JEZ08_16660 [Clostridiales bacterium]|nr:hypothetical protein [Clostridiales bacterium]
MKITRFEIIINLVIGTSLPAILLLISILNEDLIAKRILYSIVFLIVLFNLWRLCPIYDNDLDVDYIVHVLGAVFFVPIIQYTESQMLLVSIGYIIFFTLNLLSEGMCCLIKDEYKIRNYLDVKKALVYLLAFVSIIVSEMT